MDSAGHATLAAIAGRTERIRLGTAVTVLSTQDPVRVYTEFATLDAVSNGRAQLVVGRSLTQSFPLFGSISPITQMLRGETRPAHTAAAGPTVTWSGTVRSRYLPVRFPAEGHLPTWVGVGGSPQSVIRAARHGLPLMLAVIGGPASRFAPDVELYRRALDQNGVPGPADWLGLARVRGQDRRGAVDIQWPHWAHMLEAASRERTATPDYGQFKPRSPADRCMSDRRTPSRRSPGGPSSGCSAAAASTWPTPPDEYPTNKGRPRIESTGREAIPRVRNGPTPLPTKTTRRDRCRVRVESTRRPPRASRKLSIWSKRYIRHVNDGYDLHVNDMRC